MDWFIKQFIQTFITDSRWRYFTDGIVVTIELSLMAVILGVLIGAPIAMIRSTYDAFKFDKNKDKSFKMWILMIIDSLCKIYVTVVRGVPVTVQLLVSWFVIFQGVSDKYMLLVIGLTLGINSGAYVAEIVRSGIMSIDKGQTEAGRSLGLSHIQTMRYIVIPQAIKNILPAIGNEFISLLKETVVCGFVGLTDLTKGAMIVQSRTYSPTMPYLTITVIYLALTSGIAGILSTLEKRFLVYDKH